MPARFARRNDQATLIRAARLLADRGWQGQLLLAGCGKAVYGARRERLVRSLGLEGHVQFLGNINDLPQRLAASRMAALASWQEGLPLVLAQAMGAGCAVAASNIPGIADILRDSPDANPNGWLFPAGDAEKAAAALWHALSDDAEAQKRADIGRRDANGHFSLMEMLRRYEDLLHSILQERGQWRLGLGAAPTVPRASGQAGGAGGLLRQRQREVHAPSAGPAPTGGVRGG